MYLDWIEDPDKDKCSKCWLKEEYCFCEQMPDPKLKHKLVCYMAVNEIKRHNMKIQLSKFDRFV